MNYDLPYQVSDISFASSCGFTQCNILQVFTGTSMTEIETYVDDFGRRRVKAVLTDKGRIETDNVIVCGGIVDGINYG